MNQNETDGDFKLQGLSRREPILKTGITVLVVIVTFVIIALATNLDKFIDSEGGLVVNIPQGQQGTVETGEAGEAGEAKNEVLENSKSDLVSEFKQVNYGFELTSLTGETVRFRDVQSKNAEENKQTMIVYWAEW